MSTTSTMMDFGAIAREVEAENAINMTSPLPSKEELENDLFAEIEAQEISELGLDNPSVFSISNDKQADFFISRYKQLTSMRDHVNEVANARIQERVDKVNAWREEELKSIENQVARIEGLLKSYAALALDGKKTKTLKLMEGSLSFKKQQPIIDYNDEKLRQFLTAEVDGQKFLEPQQPKLKWGEFKKQGSINKKGVFCYGGKSVPGIVITYRPDAFSVK